MKNVKFLFLAMFGVMFMMTSCDGLEDGLEDILTVTVPLEGVSLDIPLEVDETPMPSASMRSDDLVPFKGTYPLDLNDPMFKDIRQYIDDNRTFTLAVTMVKILVTPLTAEMNFRVEDFKAEAFVDGKPVFEFKFSPIQLNTAVANSMLDIFANQLFEKLQNRQPVTINVSGYVKQSDVIEFGKQLGFVKFVLDLAAKIDPATIL